MSTRVATHRRAVDGVLGAAARLARSSELAVRVVVPRRPGIVAAARAIAASNGVGARIELSANSITLCYVGEQPAGP